MLRIAFIWIVLTVVACSAGVASAQQQDSGSFVDPAVQQAIEHAAENTVEKAAGQAAEEAATRAVEEAAEKAAEIAAEKAAEKAAERAAEKAVEKAAKATDTEAAAEVLEKAAEKVAEKAAEQAAAEAELKAKRPDEWKGATEVEFFIFVIDIDNIDDAAQNFTANVWLRLRWKDSRLAEPGGTVQQRPIEDVWNPRVLLANRLGLVSKALPEVVDVHPDGTVIYQQRYTGQLSQPLKLKEFPFDRHTFTIQFVAGGYGDWEVEFVPGTSKLNPSLVGGAMTREWSIPDWKQAGFEALPLIYSPIEGVRAPGFAARFQAERYTEYYVWQVLMPLAVVIMMSWASFWIGRQHVGVRIGVATSSILTLIAHRFVLASLLPKLPYMTRLDYFTVGSTLMVFLALLLVVMTSYLAAINRHLLARVVDLLARVAFPGAFVLLLGWFLTG